MQWSVTGALSSYLRKGVWWSALLIGVILVASGCRESQGPDAGPVGEEFHFHFTRGTTYTMTRWRLDVYGYRIPNSNVQRYWVVLADSVRAAGWNGVSVVLDSVAGATPDTLLFRCTPEGDIYQYGLLAGAIERLAGRSIPARWDLLASFSQGLESSWVVGTGDSLGTTTVMGQTNGNTMLFQVLVNGVSMLFQAHEVEILSDDIACTYWVADSPSAFTYLREEPFVPGNTSVGQVSDLSAINQR